MMRAILLRLSRTCALVASAVLMVAASRSARAQASPASAAKPDFTAADVQFMQGMIGHHAQALVMAAMAPTHGASPQVSLFCKKITISQRDEIDLMRAWLTDRGQKLPAERDAHAGMSMPGMSMPGMDMRVHSTMPGMLTAAQLKELDLARGAEFDRLFLKYMIQHHEGALAMVATLFDTAGSGQGAELFGYATGVDNDQRAEIERMQGMLTTISRRAP